MEALTFRYRRASEPAIRDLSLTVGPGEVLLVAGPSGCGKSTLIRAINGLIPHAYRGEQRGVVRVEGRSVAELRMRDISLAVGTMLQDPSRQIVGSTVEAELAFGPENLGQPPAQIRERIGQVIAEAGIQALAGRDTAGLSGGERQLVAMAGTLMLRPRLYVVDEPLANLDPATARRLLLTLRALADEGHAVVIVEHRVEEALALRPDRVLYLDEGVARYLGPVDGFLRMADPEAVRLPFEVVLERARQSAPRVLAAPRARGPAEPVRLAFGGVRVELGGRPVIRGLTADLGARQVVAVLGPNGSGKTTMFRTAMRLIDPSAGSVSVDGRPAADRTVADLARVFGYVFQSPSQMLFARTVREELLFGPRNLGMAMDDADQTALASLRRASLDEEGILDRPPLTLSFGQQKRLALAIGLALRPPTLILDEPSAGQDHRSATRFMEAVRGISELESLYFVTHDVDLALSHADRILVIRDGELVADGLPEEVILDEGLWLSCNLYRTSLIGANLAHRSAGARFLDASALAQLIVASESERRNATEGARPPSEPSPA
ncbi:MAG: energy-coupling factor ABC transporter ATP-binding protein [Chloroflexota bacterium]|nr:energy-coupling factor ABC transporter ATP-binding protein [Chloroflexota bacterium]